MIIPTELLTGIIGFAFTLFIFSYLLGDNPFYRIGVYVFVGVSAGYIASVAFWQVVMPKLILPLANGDLDTRVLAVVPLLFSVLLLLKISPRLSQLASPAMAFLVGVAAAVAVGGAVAGTIVPQTLAAINAFDRAAAAARNVSVIEMLFNGSIVLVGTVTTLAYFHFGARQSADGSMKRLLPIEAMAWVGRIFIAITLGVLFAGAYSAALTAFIERINFMISFFRSF